MLVCGETDVQHILTAFTAAEDKAVQRQMKRKDATLAQSASDLSRVSLAAPAQRDERQSGSSRIRESYWTTHTNTNTGYNKTSDSSGEKKHAK